MAKDTEMNSAKPAIIRMLSNVQVGAIDMFELLELGSIDPIGTWPESSIFDFLNDSFGEVELEVSDIMKFRFKKDISVADKENFEFFAESIMRNLVTMYPFILEAAKRRETNSH